ncbi:hypothetical protein CC2G_007993 [Coprinopsis cinerea AmutBmut pab1-1]|nr:hypothetical protein CC2G_007993 [Coprinopsis cinerea AmutBmut pab1-1]
MATTQGILKKLLHEALCGPTPSIQDLTRYTIENHVTDVAVLDVAVTVLACVRPPVIINRWTPSHSVELFVRDTETVKAVAALQLLAAYIGGSIRQTLDHKAVVLRRLERAWSTVCRWLKPLAVTSHEDLCILVVFVVLFTSDRGRILITHSRVSVDIIFTLWTSPIYNTKINGAVAHLPGRSVIFEITFNTLMETEGRYTLLRIMSARGPALEFSFSLLRRLSGFREALQAQDPPFHEVLRYIASFASNLCHFQNSRQVWAAFALGDALGLIIRLLRVIVARFTSQLTDDDWNMIGFSAFIMFEETLAIPMVFNSMGHAVAVLQAGLVPLVMKVISAAERGPGPIEPYRERLAVIGSLLVYPSIFDSLRSVFQRTGYNQSTIALQECSESTKSIWRSVSYEFRAVESYRQSRQADTGHFLCDNLQHDTGVFHIKHKFCACRTVVYCSVKCQTRDWTEGHRADCAFSNQIFARQDHIPGRVKLHLTGYLVYMFEKSPLPSTPLDHQPRVAVIQGNGLQLAAWVPLSHFIAKKADAPIQVRATIQRFTRGVPSLGTLVEGIFCWGHLVRIHVVALLKERTGKGKNRVVSSVVYLTKPPVADDEDSDTSSHH